MLSGLENMSQHPSVCPAEACSEPPAGRPRGGRVHQSTLTALTTGMPPTTTQMVNGGLRVLSGRRRRLACPSFPSRPHPFIQSLSQKSPLPTKGGEGGGEGGQDTEGSSDSTPSPVPSLQGEGG